MAVATVTHTLQPQGQPLFKNHNFFFEWTVMKINFIRKL
jgi:hypothetical protein